MSFEKNELEIQDLFNLEAYYRWEWLKQAFLPETLLVKLNRVISIRYRLSKYNLRLLVEALILVETEVKITLSIIFNLDIILGKIMNIYVAQYILYLVAKLTKSQLTHSMEILNIFCQILIFALLFHRMRFYYSYCLLRDYAFQLLLIL